jgi:hypothetical protein
MRPPWMVPDGATKMDDRPDDDPDDHRIQAANASLAIP